MNCSLRSDIKRLVNTITPCDKEELEHLEFTRTWIDSGADLFRIAKPATPAIHLVSYFVLIDEEEDQVLLTDHKNASLWLPTGGHVEPHEHPKSTVEREIVEELGIQADFLLPEPMFLTVTKTIGDDCHTDVSLWYLLKGHVSQQYQFDPEEFHQIRWFSKCDIPYSNSDPNMKRFIQKLSSLSIKVKNEPHY